MLKSLVAAVVGLAAVLAPAQGASTTNGKFILKNYSSAEVVIGNLGVDNDVVVAPYRGKATFRGMEKFTTYEFGIDADGDFVADRTFTVNLNGTSKATVTVGDFGLAGLLSGPE